MLPRRPSWKSSAAGAEPHEGTNKSNHEPPEIIIKIKEGQGGKGTYREETDRQTDAQKREGREKQRVS